MVRDDDERAAFGLPHGIEQVTHDHRRLVVEVAGRLVGQDQPWLIRKCPRNSDTLALTAGQLARPMPKPLAQSDTLE